MNREDMREKKIRKTRSDKKRDVKPTIPLQLKNCIYRLSYITNTPVKDVTEILCIKGIKNRNVIEFLSQYFRRDYYFRNTLFIGSLDNEVLYRNSANKKNERITTRFTQQNYEEIYKLSIALDVTPSKATAILLDASIKNSNILNSFIKVYLNNHIDNNRRRELKEVLKYINSNNPYNEEISWFSLVSFIYEEIKENTSNIKEKIYKWMENKNN